MKIDTEVAGLKTMLESHKLDTIKYLAGRLQWRMIVQRSGSRPVESEDPLFFFFLIKFIPQK